MALCFRDAVAAPLRAICAEAPGGTVIGVIGDDPAAVTALLSMAAGNLAPASGSVTAPSPARYLPPDAAPEIPEAALIAIDQTLACQGPPARARAGATMEQRRRAGSIILIASQEQDLLTALCDEVWWLDEGALAAQGDPREVLDAYNRRSAERIRAWAAGTGQPLAPSLRRGDGRARVTALETLDAAGAPSMVWRSGEDASVRVTVAFDCDVEDPVVGIMIRTRIGFEVYGTNTELERLPLGPVRAGETRCVRFAFRCDLCPQEYTLTAASHDPDGVWHDWLEDAVAFSVADSRYTAGVANLRARVTRE